MFGSTVFAFLFLPLAGGGPNEMLEVVPTDLYWQQQAVEPTAEAMLEILEEPPEARVDAWIRDLSSQEYQVRTKATEQLKAAGPAAYEKLEPLAEGDNGELAARAKEIRAGAGAWRVKRLMAIRTLGETEAGKAAPRLEMLAKSKEPSVGLYARRALAAIAGKPMPRASVTAAQREADVWMLPAECGLVAQAVLGGELQGEPLRIPAAIKLANLQQVEMPAGEMTKQVTRAVVSATERIGNARIDLLTCGLSKETGPGTGFFVVVGRGLCDAEAAVDAWKSLVGTPGRSIGTKAGLTFHVVGNGSVAVAHPSDERFVLVVGPNVEQMPLEELAASFAGDARPLKGNKEMVKLLEGMDREGPIWFAGTAFEVLAEAPVVALAQSFRLTTAFPAKGTGMDMVFRMTSESPEQSRAARDDLQELLTDVDRGLDRMSKHVGAAAEIKLFLSQARITQKDKVLRAEVHLSPETRRAFAIWPMLMPARLMLSEMVDR